MALTFTEKAKQLGATSFFPCPQWVSFRIDNCKILFEPNVYNGTGDENRVNICFKSDELVQKVLEFEKQLPGSVSSAVKNEMEHVKTRNNICQLVIMDFHTLPWIAINIHGYTNTYFVVLLPNRLGKLFAVH